MTQDMTTEGARRVPARAVSSFSLSDSSSSFSSPFFFSSPLFCGWLVLFIEALVLFPNIEREGSQHWRANLKGDSKYQLS